MIRRREYRIVQPDPKIDLQRTDGTSTLKEGCGPWEKNAVTSLGCSYDTSLAPATSMMNSRIATNMMNAHSYSHDYELSNLLIGPIEALHVSVSALTSESMVKISCTHRSSTRSDRGS